MPKRDESPYGSRPPKPEDFELEIARQKIGVLWKLWQTAHDPLAEPVATGWCWGPTAAQLTAAKEIRHRCFETAPPERINGKDVLRKEASTLGRAMRP